MSKFALIGHPLGHSMSPLIHEKLFALSGMTDAEYSLLDIDPADLPQKRELLGSLGGLNVTIPHKQAVIPLLDELGESAQRYNSVNCIKNDGGRLTGYNTDCDGFLRSAELLPLGGKVAILGCGGVGRMREVCGAFTGAVMVLGLKFGNTIGSDRAAKGKDYERVQLFAKRFKEELGSDTIICRELLGLSGPSDPDPAKRTKEYYQKRPCPETVAIASGLLGEFME